MSIASVTQKKYQKNRRRHTLPQVDESDKIINEMRRKQIARLNAALQAIKEIKEEKYNENQCVVGTGIVLENQSASHARSIGNRLKVRSSSLGAIRQRTVRSSSLATISQRTAINLSLRARMQRKEEKNDRTLEYVR